MTWIVRNIERDREIIDAIDGSDDCAAAIKAGAYLEDRLASLLKARDIPPPSSFWKKIEAARPHELFTEELAERLRHSGANRTNWQKIISRSQK
jgi:hypothetical protein